MCNITVLAGDVYSTGLKDTVSFMMQVEKFGNAHKGALLSVLVDEFRKNSMPIKFIGFGTTSPWIHPQGKAYFNRVTISCFDGYENFMNNKSTPVLQIYIQDAYMEADEFEGRFNSQGYEISPDDQIDLFKSLFKIGSVEYMVVPRDTSKAK